MAELSLRPQTVVPQAVGSLLARIAGARVLGDPAVQVTGITHDSRQVRRGDLYVARAGEHTHGIDHIDSAVQSGASAVLTDPPSADLAAAAGVPAVVVVAAPKQAMGPAAAWVYRDPADDLLLVGITGTNGKTTTGYLVDAGLRAAGALTGLIGTIETRIGDEVLPSARTTPEATELQALFAVMRERNVSSVTMEVSSHALALGRVDGTMFDLAAFTNLSQDHLDFHRDMDDYFAAKALLFTRAHAGRGVVYVEDEWGARLAERAEVPVTTVGRDTGSQWLQRDDVDAGAAGGHTTLVDPGGAHHLISSRLIGRVNLANAALAYVTLQLAGIDADDARVGIAGLPSIPGRMETVQAGQAFAVIVDYAHTPSAVRSLLWQANEIAHADGASGRVIVVLGCGGDRDRGKRPAMGAAAATGADTAIFTTDNPRSEQPDAILDAMRAGVPSARNVIIEPDRRTAIERAVVTARSGDVVVIAGKGHEQGQEIDGQVLPFDDRAEVRAALAASAAGAS